MSSSRRPTGRGAALRPTTTGRRRQTKNQKVIAARPAVSKSRVFVLLVVLAMVAGAFSWRLVDLQLTPDAALAGEVGSQVRETSIPAPRGQIVDRYGRPIAYSLPRPTIVANPRLLQAADIADEDADLLSEAVAALSPLLSTAPDVLRDRLSSDRVFVNLERQVDEEVGDAVRALSVPGVYLIDEQRREHPHGSCSGISVVGRVDVDQVGISGLEDMYDDTLTGSAGTALVQTQAGGDVRIPGGYQVVEKMTPGDDLAITIDRNTQLFTEELLVEALDAAGGERAIAILMDPNTGEVLAMANVVRDPEGGGARCTTTNLATTWTYEPGSIMKPLTFASVFENDKWPEFYPIEVEHELYYGLEDGKSHSYWDLNVPIDGEEHTPAWILRTSSNTGTVALATELGPDLLYKTLLDFGLGEVTPLGLAGEASGILDPLDSHSLELSNAAIGQSVAVTPMQMAVAYTTLASGGLATPPVLLLDDVGVAAPERILSQETADTLMNMLTDVVIGGTGKRAAIPGYHVAGKTGTAWQPCDIGYVCIDRPRHRTASFAGIVSNDSGPVLSAIVVIDRTADEHAGGGTVAAPVFADLMTYALQQMKVPPLAAPVTTGGRVRAPAAQPLDTLGDEGTGQESP